MHPRQHLISRWLSQTFAKSLGQNTNAFSSFPKACIHFQKNVHGKTRLQNPDNTADGTERPLTAMQLHYQASARANPGQCKKGFLPNDRSSGDWSRLFPEDTAATWVISNMWPIFRETRAHCTPRRCTTASMSPWLHWRDYPSHLRASVSAQKPQKRKWWYILIWRWTQALMLWS